MTPTVIAQPADLAPTGPSLTYPRPDPLPADLIVLLLESRRDHRLALRNASDEPGTTRVVWRGDQPADVVPTAELIDFLDRECGKGWEHGADAAGFEDFTVRDDEGDVLAELEHF